VCVCVCVKEILYAPVGANYTNKRKAETLRHRLHTNTLQHTASHCNTLQHTATHCNTLHHPHQLVPITISKSTKRPSLTEYIHSITLQHAATSCNTLQHTHQWAPITMSKRTKSPSVIESKVEIAWKCPLDIFALHRPPCCSVLHCSVLQCVRVWCNVWGHILL